MVDSIYKVQEETLIRDDITSYLNRHESKDLLEIFNLDLSMMANLL